MKKEEKAIFIGLFREACRKCFGMMPEAPLSETDSRLLSNKILENTGLVIGARSIKNYSYYILNMTSEGSKEENPSAATLDTLARYVLDAPYTDEIKRKDFESHHPYWYEYRRRFLADRFSNKKLTLTRNQIAIILLTIVITGALILTLRLLPSKPHKSFFRDDFTSVRTDTLRNKGWLIKCVDSTWWSKRDELKGHLALFTLRGDNWPLGENRARIPNLVMRKINSNSFTVEVNLTDFRPSQNWQQAGILLAEDSTFSGKMIRLSISYNDYFGGYDKPPEIIIQAVSSLENSSLSKPEEIAHLTLFTLEQEKKSLAVSNLARIALRIEKRSSHFRFLYTASPEESFAFREIFKGDFDIKPEYVSIFSIQGWAASEIIPAYFDSFILDESPGEK
jgi:hypothetical protein